MYVMDSSTPILKTEDLRMHFPVKGGVFRPLASCKAVDAVSLSIEHGETLGLVGESGCGKSTLVKQLHDFMNLLRERSVLRVDLASMSRGQLKPYRREIQMIFRIRMSL